MATEIKKINGDSNCEVERGCNGRRRGHNCKGNRIHIRTKGQIDREMQKAPQETAILQNDGTRVEWRRMETPLSIDYKKSYTANLCEESREAKGWENLKTDE